MKANSSLHNKDKLTQSTHATSKSSAKMTPRERRSRRSPAGQAQRTPAKPQAHNTPRRGWPATAKVALLVCVALLAGLGTWIALEFVIWNSVPAELVGKWVVQHGPQQGATFDFYRSGTMVGKVNAGGKEAVINATIYVEDKTIYSTTKHPQTGQTDTKKLMIRTLTATQLEVQDEQGQVLKMERAR
jgi:uncharacterized protein (TIGR03066 family)